MFVSIWWSEVLDKRAQLLWWKFLNMCCLEPRMYGLEIVHWLWLVSSHDPLLGLCSFATHVHCTRLHYMRISAWEKFHVLVSMPTIWPACHNMACVGAALACIIKPICSWGQMVHVCGQCVQWISLHGYGMKSTFSGDAVCSFHGPPALPVLLLLVIACILGWIYVLSWSWTLVFFSWGGSLRKRVLCSPSSKTWMGLPAVVQINWGWSLVIGLHGLDQKFLPVFTSNAIGAFC